MKIEQRHSYGVLPVYENENGAYEILVIDQKHAQHAPYWTFPKGTPEDGETPLETAMRETEEEVGITFDVVLEEPSFTTDLYITQFPRSGVEAHKRVTYYLGYAHNKNFKLQETEIRAARWCSFDEAQPLLTYKNTKKILDEVRAYLNA